MKEIKTVLVLTHSVFRIECAVFSSLNPRWRRQVALQVYRALEESFGDFGAVTLHRNDQTYLDPSPPRLQPPDLRRAVRAEHPGLRYRLRRLQHGVSLRQTARECRISYSHLSRFERGKARMFKRTRARLDAYLFRTNDTIVDGATL